MENLVINHIFNLLASDTGRNFKISVLKANQSNELLKKVIHLALDPFTQFYIRKIPTYFTGQVMFNLEQALNRLYPLQSRMVTGNTAIAHLAETLSGCSADDAKVIERIISKDLKCGVSEATVNAVWPGLIHEYPCMLASAYDQKLVDKVEFPAYVQLKLDGMRFNAIVRQGAVEFRSRNGKEIQIADPTFALPFIHMAGFYGQDMVFDGELLVVDFAGKTLDRKTGNGILNKAVKGTQSAEEGEMVRATVWDAIPFEKFEQGVDKEIYKTRIAKLSNCVSNLRNNSPFGHRVDLVPHKQVESMEQAQKLFETYLADGQEGIILKTKNMIWENKRSKHQIKFKQTIENELRVVGYQWGTGKNEKLLGALVCESEDGIIHVNVGTGFSDEQRAAFTPENIVGSIITVAYNAVIDDKTTKVKSLFLPRFIEVRLDKSVADVGKDFG